MAHRIVVGVDGSEGARTAMRWALEEAALHHSTVLAVHAWSADWAEGYNPEWAHDRQAFEADARTMIASVVADAQAHLGGVEIVPEVQVVQGVSPSAALVEASAHADLLVVGCRGRSALTSLALGSVSTACAHRAPCPVVVVRAKADDPGPAQ